MQLVRLSMTNFCQHRKLVVDFPIGITGIVGPNGSGKSTIPRALQFGFLSKSGNPGTIADDLNWAAAVAGEPGDVELDFVANGDEGKLKRALHQSRASLKCGDVNVRSVSAVNTEILRLLGTSKSTLEDVVFVMQGAIERILFDRPAVRKQNIHALFGIDKTEPIRVLLLNEIGSLNLSPLDDRLVELKSRIEVEIDPQLRALSTQREQFTAEIASYNSEELQQTVTSFEASAQLSQHVAGMEAQLHSLEAQPDVDVSTLEAELAAKKADVESKTASIDQMKAKLANLQSQQQTSNTRAALLSELQTLEAKIAAVAPTAPNFDASILSELEIQIAESQGEVANKQTFIDAFEGAGDTVCPTCHQPVENAGAMAAAMKPELEQRKQLITNTRATLEQARRAISTYENALLAYNMATMQAAERKASVENLLVQIPDVGSIDAAAVTSMQQAISAFSLQVSELSKLDSRYNQAVQVKTGRDAQINGLKQSIQQARQQVGSQSSVVDYEQAKLALQFVLSTREKLAELEGQFKQLQVQRASTLNELQSVEAKAQQMENLKKYQTLCERSRTVLHYDNLPRLAMQKYLGVLNSKLNEFLSIFNVPFTASIKNDMSVVCHVAEGEKTADRLSGGQKVMLGIAFRIAIYTMFASDLGFMVLDEPTNMLDNERVDCVASMLESVGAYAKNAKMQMIVITHHEELMRTFDHTVQLA